MTTAWNEDQLYSSKRQDWGTPQALFDALHEEFGFGLDAAATAENAKCLHYIDKDSLFETLEDPMPGSLWANWPALIPGSEFSSRRQEWICKQAIWLNPPYGKDIGKWIKKAYRESLRGCTVVVLTFVRSDTKWWHDWAMKAAEIRLIKGRIKFEGAPSAAPAPSCLLIFDESRRVPQFTPVTDLPRR
jgi:site-specific DNA-methyltransferase (adenine-specific)